MPQGDNLRGKPRHPLAGRKKGQKTKVKIEFETATQVLERMGLNPTERMAQMANGDVPCGVCFGKGKTRWQPRRRKALEGLELEEQPEADTTKERTCQSCYGSGKEQVSPELRGKMLEALSRKVHPDLKAIEHSGAGGGPIQHEIIPVQFIKAKVQDGPVS